MFHWLGTAYNWVVNEGFWRDVIAVAATSMTAPILALKPIKRHFANQRKIGDLLDTHTPGGLTDVVDSLTKMQRGESGSIGDIGTGPGGDAGAT